MVSVLDVARATPVQQSPNGILYASYGQTHIPTLDLEHMVQAVPQTMAAALQRKAYYFVPLVVDTPGEVLVAPAPSDDLVERAICHRNVPFQGAEYVFISTQLMHDRFSLAFEFFINVGRNFVDTVGVPEGFSGLVGTQVSANVHGETSQDAWEARKQAYGARDKSVDEKARLEHLSAAFSDAIAIYLLSLTVDFDYSELREREYPLLAPQALAERLRHVAGLFPPNTGYEFAVRPRRHNG